MENINEIIKRLRKKKKLTQKNIADRLHIARSTYSKLESGNTKLDHERLKNIALILDVPVAEILSSDVKIPTTVAEDLSLMLLMTSQQLEEELYEIIPYHELTDEHIELLKKLELDSREKYEEPPLGGRIYKFGPRDLFRYMMENCGMDNLFNNGLIQDKYWLHAWMEYKKSKEKIKMFFDSKGEIIIEDTNQVEIDDADYFLVFLYHLTFPDNTYKYVQFAQRDFPEGADEWGALEYIKLSSGAISGDIVSFSLGGYDPVSEIME